MISAQVGGEYYSYGRGYRLFFGTDKRSLVGRETGIVEEGINEFTGFDNDMTKTMLRNTFIQSASISAIGRNLFFLYNASGDIDPEGSYSSGPTSTAFEHSSLPSTRNYGVNLKLNF